MPGTAAVVTSLRPTALDQGVDGLVDQHANPGGALPNWLVNYVSGDLPFKTIEGLRAQVKRRHYPEFEAHIKEHFARYPFLWPRS